MDSRFERDLFIDLYHLVEGTDTFESVTADLPMFSNTGSSWQCLLFDYNVGAIMSFEIPIVDFYLYYEPSYGNSFNGALQKVYEDLLNNIERDYLKEHPEDTELEGMVDWFVDGASGDSSYNIQVYLLVTFEYETGNLVISGDVSVDSYSDIYRAYNIHVFYRIVDMSHIDSNQNRFKERFFDEVLTSFNDLIEEL